jgi:4-hydroxythreonine-4-phosphate dehydrogenase
MSNKNGQKYSKPILGITMGDPFGIGPEIAAKAFGDQRLHQVCCPILIGDSNVMEQAVNFTNTNLKIRTIEDINDAKFEAGTIDLVDLKNVDMIHFEYGKVSSMAGNAAFEYVKKVIDLAVQSKIDGTVTGPIHKESINLAGHHFSGHTEIYAYLTNTKKYAMLLVDQNLKVIHVSTHVSLRQACDLVKKQRVIDVIDLMNEGLKLIGFEKPAIGVAGLNPHASDGGLFGNEEATEIIPAIRDAKKRGINVEGPIPGDTLFAKAQGGYYNGCVAMYHDQGHIPFKMKGFVWNNEKKIMQSVSGVNITLGLPIIRTSVDHGTAFEIAGKGVASHYALILAANYASLMTKSKKQTKF